MGLEIIKIIFTLQNTTSNCSVISGGTCTAEWTRKVGTKLKIKLNSAFNFAFNLGFHLNWEEANPGTSIGDEATVLQICGLKRD